MPIRSKSSTKLDHSQSETLSQRRTKRLRIDSDEDQDEGYEQQRHTSYNESYTRRGPGNSSPDAPVTTKRQKPVVPSSDDDGEDIEYDTRLEDYEEPEDEGDGYDETENKGGRREHDHDRYETARSLGKKRRTSLSSPLSSRMDSSPPPTAAVASSSLGGRSRKISLKAKYLTSTSTLAAKTKSASSAKGKQKANASAAGSNKRKRQDEDENEEEYQNFEDEEVEIEDEEEEARFSDDYEDYEDERPPRGKKGRGGKGGRAREREKDKDKDMLPILKKAKFEGNAAVVGSTIASKRTRTKKLTGEDSVVDIVDETPTPEPSSTGSPAATNPTMETGKDDNVPSAAPPQKKRKLPTIKKLKSSASQGGGTGPSTPSSVMATGNKQPVLPPPPPGGVAGNGVNKLGIADSSKSMRPKTNTTIDLDLSNPSLYAELFKNPGGSASRTGLNRRAKEEERRKELDKMREEYKAKFAEEAKLSFDLQGQAEKMARFEETLRQRHSSALYPNFLAAKWREEWEREKRRAHKREYQQQSQPNGNINNAKEEGEM